VIFENCLLTTLTSGSDTSLAGVVSAATFSDLVELPGGVFRMGSQRLYPDGPSALSCCGAFASVA
jgi:hypothetical protein